MNKMNYSSNRCHWNPFYSNIRFFSFDKFDWALSCIKVVIFQQTSDLLNCGAASAFKISVYILISFESCRLLTISPSIILAQEANCTLMDSQIVITYPLSGRTRAAQLLLVKRIFCLLMNHEITFSSSFVLQLLCHGTLFFPV